MVGLGADPAARAQLGPAGSRFASLYRLGHSGSLWQMADLGQYEADANPDGGPADSNPFSIDANGHKLAITDAGGNDLLSVNPCRVLRIPVG